MAGGKDPGPEDQDFRVRLNIISAADAGSLCSQGFEDRAIHDIRAIAA